MNVIAADAQTFRLWASFLHRQLSHLWTDAMIGVTALRHGMTIATRNLRDFEAFPVAIVTPSA